MTPSARLPSGTLARGAGDLRARGDIRLHTAIYRRRCGRGCETALQGRCATAARARTLRLVATPGGGAPAEPPVRPSTKGMLTISRPPPRRCSAACLLGSAAIGACAFCCLPLAALCDHGPCCTLPRRPPAAAAPAGGAPGHVESVALPRLPALRPSGLCAARNTVVMPPSSRHRALRSMTQVSGRVSS
jgi:hypothetical protein